MEWTDQALVLRMGAFRESDLWLKLLCREHGLLTLFAFGGSRSRRRFCGCLDVLNSLQCRVRSSKDGRFLNLGGGGLAAGAAPAAAQLAAHGGWRPTACALWKPWA